MYVSSRSVLLLILAMMLVTSPSAVLARRGGGQGGRPGGRPQGRPEGQQQRPQGDGERPEGRPEGQERPQGDGERPDGRPDGRPEGQERPQGGQGAQGGRGPPGTGIFSISADRPALLGSIVESRGATIAPVNGLMAVYEGKVEDTLTPVARRSLLHAGGPEDMVLLSSNSADGATWSEGSLLTISGLPTGLIARKPTLSADGTLLFFVGATGDLKSTPSAIHVAKCTAAEKCTYSGVAFEQPGKIMSGCAYANGKLIVPNAGDMEVEDPVTPEPVPEPTPVPARKLMANKKMPRAEASVDRKNLAGEAWVATCTDAGVCKSDGTLVAMPDADADAKGKGAPAWRGSMVFANGQHQFYGSGQGYWPVVSSDGGATWERTTADLAVDLPGPDPSCANTASGLVCAGGMKKRKAGKGDRDQEPEDPSTP